jgi:hypothetical protein
MSPTCRVDACGGSARRSCPNACADFFHGSPLRRSFGVEANRTLNVFVARAEMNCCCRFCVAIPTGVPAVARARHSGTTRLSVHCGSSDLGRTPKGTPGRGASVDQPANLSELALWARFVGWGRADRFPDAFKRAGRRCLLPVANKDRPPGAIRMGTRAESRAIASCGRRLSDVANAAQAALCEFCEHRSPPVPLLAVGGERWETTA